MYATGKQQSVQTGKGKPQTKGLREGEVVAAVKMMIKD
jgi:hypothetical protein